MIWTDEQRLAIETKQDDGSILVSAAAGSGKTAVLVERVIRHILIDGISIDRILVVTFTEAAAAEMRDKIIRRLRTELDAAQKPEDINLLKNQLQLSADADIMTIDAFCLRVLKNNFYVLGVDPDFRITDSAEAELIAEDAADALFDRLYRAEEDSEDGKRFNRLLNIYATNKSDAALKELVPGIHRFIQSFARPMEWLDEKAAMYDNDMSKSVWMREIMPELLIRRTGREYYGYFSGLLSRMGEACLNGYDGSVPTEEQKAELTAEYGEIANGLCRLQEAAEKLAEAEDWNGAQSVYDEYIRGGGGMDSLTAVNSPKGIRADRKTWKIFCKARNNLRDAFFKECAVFGEDMDTLSRGNLKKQADELIWIVKEFDKEFSRRKDMRNAREFSDIEHLVYRLFSENGDVRERYRAKYDEILIDEYQDTNGLQDSVFQLISRDETNLFMVGDLKQSIYRFRGGDPTIFKSKSIRGESEDCGGTRIDLSQNFRSRQEILHSVNDVFDSIMTEKVGDVNYAGKERIIRLSDADEHDDMYKSEAHFVMYTKDGDEEMTAFEAEAEFIADKIAEMKGGALTIDDGNGERAVQNRDICILMRSVRRGAGTVLSDALLKCGITSYVEIEDYFEKREVRLMMSLISLIDNNFQDIPLMTVMRSPIGDFSDNDLARIRIASPNTDLFTAVKNYGFMKNGEGVKSVKTKCAALAENLGRWRGYVKRKSVAKLIWSIYEETGLYDFMGALEGGEEAQANLRLLYERAKQYEQSGFRGLFNFIRYIEKLENRKGDLSSASLIGEGHDVVRIMTIHKSKGLEFPVVFLAGMGKSIAPRASRNKIELHKDLGFGIERADLESGYFEDTVPAYLVREQNRREDFSEAMRLLYVGMTRPKYKLIVVASKKFPPRAEAAHMKKVDEQLQKWETGIAPDKAKSYADWIFPTAMRRGDSWSFETHYYSQEYFDDEEIPEIPDIKVSDELREAVKRSFEYQYKYPESGYIPAKTSVTALKRKRTEDEFDAENADRKYEFDPIYMDDMPAFMNTGKSGAQIGTAHHQVMAYIDMDGIRKCESGEYAEFIGREMERLVKDGQLDKYYIENSELNRTIKEHISEFFKSALGARILRAKTLYREKPFQIEIGADVYDASLSDKYADEKVILQGVIDCFFENDDGTITLLDYKTDRCSSDGDADEIAEKYAVQLRLYSDAIERVTGKRVTEKYLYLFAYGREREIK